MKSPNLLNPFAVPVFMKHRLNVALLTVFTALGNKGDITLYLYMRRLPVG